MTFLNSSPTFVVFDSGMFNWIVYGYCSVAMDVLNIDKDTKREVLSEIKYQFDFMTAKEAEEYYRSN